jgi:hypothetical protein
LGVESGEGEGKGSEEGEEDIDGEKESGRVAMHSGGLR